MRSDAEETLTRWTMVGEGDFYLAHTHTKIAYDGATMRILRIAGLILLVGSCSRFLTHRFEVVFDIMGPLGALLVLPSAIRDMIRELRASRR